MNITFQDYGFKAGNRIVCVAVRIGAPAKIINKVFTLVDSINGPALQINGKDELMYLGMDARWRLAAMGDGPRPMAALVRKNDVIEAEVTGKNYSADKEPVTAAPVTSNDPSKSTPNDFWIKANADGSVGDDFLEKSRAHFQDRFNVEKIRVEPDYARVGNGPDELYFHVILAA
jgi:hypothetical protein